MFIKTIKTIKPINLPKEILENILFYTGDIFVYFNMYLEYNLNNDKYNSFYEKRFIILLEKYKRDNIITIYKNNKKILDWIKKKFDNLNILYINSYEKMYILNKTDIKTIMYFYSIDNFFNKNQLRSLNILYPELNKTESL